jgi:hypothetical protein
MRTRPRSYAEEWARRTGFSKPAAASVIGRAVLQPERRAEALALLRQMEREDAPARELAGVALVLGDHESAVRLLQVAFDEGDPQLALAAVEPTLDPLRDDPRFVRILEELRLPAGSVR